MWQKRGPALLCLLLATALTVFAAARSPAAPPGEVPPPQTLEEESLLYEETPVQIISLLDLEPVDTRASANPVRVGGGTLDPVDQAEMASVLAECTLKDNTIVRLYVTAEGLIDALFAPWRRWIRFARLYRGADQGPNYAETAALTACSGILGHDGFLLRTDGTAPAFTPMITTGSTLPGTCRSLPPGWTRWPWTWTGTERRNWSGRSPSGRARFPFTSGGQTAPSVV